MKRQTLMAVAIALTLVIGGAAPSFAADPHTNGTTKGQPNQSCQAVFRTGPLTPQGFNTGGFAKAEAHYAGSQPQNTNKGHGHSVAQYDVACFQAGSH